MAPRFAFRHVIAVSLLFSVVAFAQNVPVPPVSAPTATPAPVPSATASPERRVPVAEARSSVDDLSSPVVGPASRPTTAVTPRAVAATPTPAITPAGSPTPAPSSRRAPPPPIETVILPPRCAAAPLWPWLLAGTLLTIVPGWLLLRRPREERVDDAAETETFVEPAPPPPPPLPPTSPDRARLKTTLRPLRAGLNLISVTAECEVTVANIGTAPADEVRAGLRLMSAHGGYDAELAAFYTAPIGRPVTPPFALAPGEERTFRAVTALPHDAIHALDVGGRPMFEPILALSVGYRDGAAPRRVGQAFVLGVERVDATRLGPFWLDGGARAYDHVNARPHGEPVEA